MSTQKGFSVGFGKINKNIDKLLSQLVKILDAMAPFEEAAEELIAFAQQTALEDWIKEKGDE
mgnify:CR=1 FL=1